jgi:hypothetical protein
VILLTPRVAKTSQVPFQFDQIRDHLMGTAAFNTTFEELPYTIDFRFKVFIQRHSAAFSQTENEHPSCVEEDDFSIFSFS